MSNINMYPGIYYLTEKYYSVATFILNCHFDGDYDKLYDFIIALREEDGGYKKCDC